MGQDSMAHYMNEFGVEFGFEALKDFMSSAVGYASFLEKEVEFD